MTVFGNVVAGFGGIVTRVRLVLVVLFRKIFSACGNIGWGFALIICVHEEWS